MVLANPESMLLIKESIADEDDRIRAVGFQCIAGLAKHGDTARETVMGLVSVPTLINIVKTTKEPILVNGGGEIEPSDPTNSQLLLLQGAREALAYLAAHSTFNPIAPLAAFNILKRIPPLRTCTRSSHERGIHVTDFRNAAIAASSNAPPRCPNSCGSQFKSAL
jgi:hypothetical protein